MASQLIPMRFVIMMGHLVILITSFWNKDEKVIQCIPWDHTEDDYNLKSTELIVGFSLAIALLTIEFIGFLSGISMFCPMHSLFSLITHSFACITLAYFITDIWNCSLYWWIFTFCSVLPAFSEFILIINIIFFKKML